MFVDELLAIRKEETVEDRHESDSDSRMTFTMSRESATARRNVVGADGDPGRMVSEVLGCE